VDTRASSNDTTLLHFLITMIEDQFGAINEHLLNDLSLCKEACRGKIKAVYMDIFDPPVFFYPLSID
jgi:hypothetical protein